MSIQERPYLSIGEVLGLLLEEFPDVTISKIRFLESQGLIDPERTPSGYRKFYDPDVDRLRVILREQRENFLPLRVIRDRLESGEIDETGGHTPPKGIRNVTMPTAAHDDETGEFTPPAGTPVPTSHHPAARAAAAQPPAQPAQPPAQPAAQPAGNAPSSTPGAPVPPSAPPPPVEQFFSGGDSSVPPTMLPVERSEYSAGDVCALARLTARQLSELESFGIVAATGSGPSAVYSPADLEVARVAARFFEHGVEPRHLRAWRQAADREAALFEQVVAPFIRQRNPQSRQQASDTLRQLSALGADLRAALLRAALQAYLDD